MSIRETEALKWFVTQTCPSCTTSEDGPSATSIRCTSHVDRETRETVWENSLATQTSVAVTAREAGPASTPMSDAAG